MNAPPSPSINLPQGIDPVDLLRQGIGEKTLAGPSPLSFQIPGPEEMEALFPQFDILEFIGSGGMGAVYKVRQPAIERTVALKILPSEIGCNPAFSGQFTREAKALAKLSHPNIVTLHDFGRAGELYYIVMEYVDGANLHQLMQNERIAPREALAIVSQICDALQYAHDCGIVHRDIKPGNILIDRKGHVKVADFGLAKLLAAGGLENNANNVAHTMTCEETLTMDGKVVGTPPYMAPEQFAYPAVIDNRTDIYALGIVFYEMLTGELPARPLSKPPSHKVQIDVKLDRIVLKALQQKPTRRYAQASIMKTAVTVSAKHLSSRRYKRQKEKVAIAAGLLALLVLGAAIIGYPFGSRAADSSGTVSAVEQSSSFLVGIDPEEKDILKLRESIGKTVAKALPKGMTVEKVLVSNDHFNPDIRETRQQMGIRTRLYARLILNKDGKEYGNMEVIAVANEEQAKQLCATMAFPYAQSKGNIAVLFSSRDDLFDDDIVIEICTNLGISHPRANVL